jgi:C4-dicarboxylate-specific signal transduction histidine kinase
MASSRTPTSPWSRGKWVSDRVPLLQVLLNLILNGVEAMIVGTDHRRELAVSSALARPGNVLVSVADRGPSLTRPSRSASSSWPARALD